MSNLLKQAVEAHQSGNISEAEKLYRAVLDQAPDQPDALALLGVVCGTKGQHDEAVKLIERAIARDAKSALFKFHLGNVLMNAKRLKEAAVAFRQAITLQPGMAQAHYNLANALRASDDWAGAIDAYHKAIQYNKDYPEAYNNLALTLVHEKRYDEALKYAMRSVEVSSQYGEGWLTLCNVAEQVKDYQLALMAGQSCIRLMPNSHYSWFGYGVALNRVDRNEEAVEAYKRALALKPERADIWDNLGQTYQALNQLDEAEATFRRTIEVAGQVIQGEDSREVDESEYGNRHWHLALMELLRGNLKSGFARYRSRFLDVENLARQKLSKPLWRGEDLNGKCILICDEQGYGDTLMFARYADLLKQRGARVKFSVHKVLKPLFDLWPGIEEVVVHGQSVSGFDVHASVFDLPYRFGTTLETIPNNVPYLPVPEADAATKLEGDGRRKIGVVWGGSGLHKNDLRRSIPLKIFADIFKEDFQFFSLNRDMKEGDAEFLPTLPVINLAPKLDNFLTAAKFVSQLDLLITCDTATAHLAGGMGKKVWTLLPYAPDWRWLTECSDSPWYPSMRLFRQPKISDWEGLIADVRKALKGFT